MTVRVVPAAEPPPGEPVGSWPLRPEPSSARLARRLVTQAMDGAQEQVLRRAALVTSELVSNSVRHARGGMSLALNRLNGGWIVAVADDSSAPPQLRDAGPLSENGRGMLIVDRVSEQLGWSRTPTGKVVWAQFADR
ncbi:ATP-binding protein [Angustibacter luteus]|uniref:ATP-binding protein n=1 Tax=Angustibacter luteus TaxID=658456 RepID=A0ABW1JCX8_9ACTN